MAKGIAIFERKPDMSREDFHKHYEEVHVPLVSKHIPTIKRYVRNYVVSSVVPFSGVTF